LKIKFVRVPVVNFSKIVPEDEQDDVLVRWCSNRRSFQDCDTDRVIRAIVAFGSFVMLVLVGFGSGKLVPNATRGYGCNGTLWIGNWSIIAVIDVITTIALTILFVKPLQEVQEESGSSSVHSITVLPDLIKTSVNMCLVSTLTNLFAIWLLVGYNLSFYQYPLGILLLCMLPVSTMINGIVMHYSTKGAFTVKKESQKYMLEDFN
jgi:hypothetical protein